MQLEELKQYMRIEHDEDDQMLESFIIGAGEYIENAIGKVDTAKHLYKMAQTMLVAHWYETREIARIGNNSYDIPHGFNAIMTQLQYCKASDET